MNVNIISRNLVVVKTIKLINSNTGGARNLVKYLSSSTPIRNKKQGKSRSLLELVKTLETNKQKPHKQKRVGWNQISEQPHTANIESKAITRTIKEKATQKVILQRELDTLNSNHEPKEPVVWNQISEQLYAKKIESEAITKTIKEKEINVAKKRKEKEMWRKAIDIFQSKSNMYPFAANPGKELIQCLRSHLNKSNENDPNVYAFLSFVDTASNTELFHKEGNIGNFISSEFKETSCKMNTSSVLHSLHRISLRLIDEQILANFPDSTNKQIHFSLAYVWSSFRGQGNSYEYLKTFLQYFLNENVFPSLTAPEFVFCVYLAGRIRRFPDARIGKEKNADQTERNIEFQISEILEKTIINHMPSLTCQEVGILANGLYTSRLLIQPENKNLRDSLLLRLLTEDDVIENQEAITPILKNLTTRDFQIDIENINLLMQKFLPIMPMLDHIAVIR